MSLLPIVPSPILLYLQVLCTTAKELLPIHHLTLHKEGQQKVEESPLGVWTSASLSPHHCSCLVLRVEKPGGMDTRKGHSTGANNHHGGKKQSKKRYNDKISAEVRKAPRSWEGKGDSERDFNRYGEFLARAIAGEGEKTTEGGVKDERSPTHFQYRNSPAAEARARLEAYTTG